ncbi:MAG: AraC family transcriptional regulator [candidate division Zixibacteria bacterium]|nr:AraC family transcriptional regulator [candidate division Zixibacteria bacterium]
MAVKTGFSDELYLSKLFKKWYGVTPTECASSD